MVVIISMPQYKCNIPFHPYCADPLVSILCCILWYIMDIIKKPLRFVWFADGSPLVGRCMFILILLLYNQTCAPTASYSPISTSWKATSGNNLTIHRAWKVSLANSVHMSQFYVLCHAQYLQKMKGWRSDRKRQLVRRRERERGLRRRRRRRKHCGLDFPLWADCSNTVENLGCVPEDRSPRGTEEASWSLLSSFCATSKTQLCGRCQTPHPVEIFTNACTQLGEK